MTIGLIGAGQIGSAMIRGFINYGDIASEEIIVKNSQHKTAENLQKELDLTLITEYKQFSDCDVIILATAGDAILSVLSEIKDTVTNNQIPIVFAASGVLISEMQEVVGKDYPLARIIPNTPVAINKGVLPISYSVSNPNDLKIIQDYLKQLGTLHETTEDQLGLAGAVAGCSPAFVDIFIESLADAAVSYGLSRDVSYDLISEMMVGSAQLLAETKEHPAVLKDSVCSPKGSTVQGVIALEKHGFRNAVIEALKATIE